MTNLLEQAINCSDGDRPPYIIETLLVSNTTTL